MTALRPKPFLVLGVFPTSRGMGWVALDGPLSVFEHGLVSPKRSELTRVCLKRFERLLERLKPETVVLEAFDRFSAHRSPRIEKLSVQMVALANDRQIEVEVYRRRQVQRAFASVNAVTREEIAEVIAKHLPTLAYRRPTARKLTDTSDRRLSIFNAAALVLTHYHYGSTAFLNDARNAA